MKRKITWIALLLVVALLLALVGCGNAGQEETNMDAENGKTQEATTDPTPGGATEPPSGGGSEIGGAETPSGGSEGSGQSSGQSSGGSQGGNTETPSGGSEGGSQGSGQSSGGQGSGQSTGGDQGGSQGAVTPEREEASILGRVGNEVVLNPVFEWTSEHDDAPYTVLLKQDDEVVAQGTTPTARFELSNNLKYGKGYQLTVTGTGGAYEYVVAFRTVAGLATPDLKQVSLTVAEPYKSHMVIQRGKAFSIKGKTAPNVVVTAEFDGAIDWTLSDETGAYSFDIAPQEACATPKSIEIRILKEKKEVLEDVLFGDVYLCAGQSNMQRGLEGGDFKTDYLEQDVEDAVAADVRYYYQYENVSATPIDTTLNGFWSAVDTSNSNYKSYSAIAFMFGSMLGKELSESGVPVGIIYAAKGDTNIVDWLSSDYYDGAIGTKNRRYNAMIYPLRNAEISGVVWYQGCNNSAGGNDYQGHLQNLFANYRALFKHSALPFYVVQLPCYNGDSGNNFDFSYVREAQYLACEADEHAYLIATCDGGDPANIHPNQKRYICERLAKSVLSTIYGESYLPQGPVYASHEVQGNKVIVTVKYGEGLTAEGEIVGFMLAGADGKYFDASATIEEGKIVLTSAEVANPVYIKYGFSKCPFLNIYNADGFLMSPFRTDDHNHNIDLIDYREEAVYTSNSLGTAMQTEVVDVDGEIGLQVTKPAGSEGYGILQLDKWGAIGYDEHVLKLRIKGSASGAKLIFRIVESSYETWATPELTDNFTTVQEFLIPFSYFSASNVANGIIDLQSTRRVELVIKGVNDAATATVLEARFVDFVRTAPAAFAITEAKNDGHEVTVKYGFSDFATSYRILVSADGTDFTAPIVDVTTTEFNYVFNAALCEADTTYYVKVIASNELGQTAATGSGSELLDLSQDKTTVAAFNFADDDSFNEYVTEKIYNEHSSNLELSRDEKGLKVHIKKTSGWMAFFVRVNAGTSEGFDSLKFYADLTEYKGNSIKVQLQTNGGSTSYTYQLNYSSKKEGYFAIPFSSFKTSGGVYYSGDDIVRVKFGFEDYTGGDSDNLYINDIEFVKS